MQQAIELGQYILMSVVERPSELNIHTYVPFCNTLATPYDSGCNILIST